MMDRREFLQAAAAVAAASAADISDADLSAQQARIIELADRDDSDRWEYETVENYAHLDTRMFYTEIDTVCETPSGRVETHAVGPGGIPLDVTVSTDDGDEIGGLVTLTADQAEAVAVDLLEQAHAKRARNE